jgi:hypothetical protein
MDIIVWRNDWRETAMKENDGGRWSSDGVVLWVRRRKNRDVRDWVVERVDKIEITFL